MPIRPRLTRITVWIPELEEVTKKEHFAGGDPVSTRRCVLETQGRHGVGPDTTTDGRMEPRMSRCAAGVDPKIAIGPCEESVRGRVRHMTNRIT